MAANRGSTRVAQVVLAAAVVAGILTMHVPFLASLGLSSAHALMHTPTAAVSSGHAMADDPASGASPASSSLAVSASATSTSVPASVSTSAPGLSTVAGGAEQLCHADPTGHGSPTSAHAASCDLSAPPLTSASALGAAALVAVVMLSLLAVPSRSVLGGRWRRRGPPAGDRLHLSLCVIRV